MSEEHRRQVFGIAKRRLFSKHTYPGYGEELGKALTEVQESHE